MCDTLAVFDRNNNRSFFGKNSDREPEELQFVYISTNPNQEFEHQPYLEGKKEYIEHSFKALKEIFYSFDNGYKAILSRPLWMWGAEMGVNEFGLSIGNEAVFSRERVQRDGLLGMDILRLALHNNKTAEGAARFIIKLITEVGQGGDGGYRGSLKYHNSFLIKDFNEAYVLETSGKHYALKKIVDSASISNAYSLSEGFEESTSGIGYNFKAEHQDKFFSFFSKGDKRQSYTSCELKSRPATLRDIKEILRSHQGGSIKPIKGTKSVCMHSGSLIKSGTTSSMIVDYIGDKFIVWFTGGPHPCVTAYKPLVFSSTGTEFHDIGKSVELGERIRGAAREMIKSYEAFLENVKPLRDELEEDFEEIMYGAMENKPTEYLTHKFIECMALYHSQPLL